MIALSSGESELYASLKASAETLGVLAMLKDLGWRMHGEVWGDANAALGIINRRGVGKTRHIETGVWWIQQTAAEIRLQYKKVFGTNNPAELFTKHLDERTSKHHIVNLGYQAAEGRAEGAPRLQAISVSIDEYLNGINYSDWEWVHYIQGSQRTRKQHIEVKAFVGDVNAVSGHAATDVWRQVLQGYTRQAQGSNGGHSAQLGRPWVSTLTFQCVPKRVIGVPCGIGLRHGVTMHPRGNHSREGMILPPHGITYQTAREQQRTIQHNNHYNWANYHNKEWRPWKSERDRDDGTRPSGEHQDRYSQRCCRGFVSLAKRQPGGALL